MPIDFSEFVYFSIFFIGNAYKQKIYLIFANECCRHSQKFIGIAYNLNFDYKLPRQVQYINCRQ